MQRKEKTPVIRRLGSCGTYWQVIATSPQRTEAAPLDAVVEPSQAFCANLMVETGHFPKWPRIEIRRPCRSSSQTLSTVPAFPSVRITALPTSSVWACSNSPRIVDARTFAVGIDDLSLKRAVLASETCASRDRLAARRCLRNRDQCRSCRRARRRSRSANILRVCRGRGDGRVRAWPMIAPI
jgi:hypothetical protein